MYYIHKKKTLIASCVTYLQATLYLRETTDTYLELIRISMMELLCDINSIRNLFSIKGINEMIYKLLVRGVLKKDVLKTFGTYLEKHLC